MKIHIPAGGGQRPRAAASRHIHRHGHKPRQTETRSSIQGVGHGGRAGGKHGVSHVEVMRESHHHFEVGRVAVKGTAHLSSTGNAGDLLPTAGAAVRAALVGWERGSILVNQVDVLHRPAPINVTSVVRLVIGAAFQKRNRAQRTSRNKTVGHEHKQQEQRGK